MAEHDEILEHIKAIHKDMSEEFVTGLYKNLMSVQRQDGERNGTPANDPTVRDKGA